LLGLLRKLMAVAFSPNRTTGAPGAGAIPATLRTLRDGTVVRLRPLGPADADELRAGFERLSAESRYRRFFSPLSRLPDALVQRLTATDGDNHVALVAETIPLYDEPPEPLGVVRYFRDAERPDAAEVAVTVIDELQGKGLGTVLLDTLARLAREHGIRVLTAQVLAGNLAMQALLRRTGDVRAVRNEQGVLSYEIALY
jgi:RimJ/RimL family protein N-acetyltransferase